MIYLKLEKKQTYYAVVMTHYRPFDPKHGLKKSELELLESGIFIEALPPMPEEIPEGHRLDFRVTLVNKEPYYEIVPSEVF